MTGLFNLFLILLLTVSLGGYMILARKVLGLQIKFIPLFVFSAIACIIYFCGLLGILLPGSILVMVLGLVIFATLFIEEIRKDFKLRLSFSLFSFFWIIGCLFFFFLLLRSRFIHYDNFSHWAIVVKQMLSTHAFPNVESDLIDFKNYPLGISCFIYYICLFAGNKQFIMTLAQNLLTFSCFYAMFGIISEKKRFLLYAFLGLGCASFSFFNITIRINNLLVDFLLPIYTLALFTMAYYYRFNPIKAFISILPVAALLTITKNIGIIFALIGLIFLLYIVLVNHQSMSKKRVLTLASITCFTAMLPYLAWFLHVKTDFNTVSHKFSIYNVVVPKTNEQIQAITSLFIRSSFDLSTRPALGILLFNFIALAAILFNLFNLKRKWYLWKSLIMLDLTVLLYYLGLWSMYIFSMPLEEALSLAGFERYTSSIVVLLAGGLILTATRDIENSFHYKIGEVPNEQAFRSVSTKDFYQKNVFACTALTIILLISEHNGMAYLINSYHTSLPSKVKAITGDRWYQDGKIDTHKYLFYGSDTDSQITNFYMHYVGRYFLYAPYVDAVHTFSANTLDSLLSQYDYLVIVESDLDERNLLYKKYGVTGQEGIYKIIHTNGQTSLILESCREKIIE